MKLMYMATDEYAGWIACPAIDMPRSQERWQASGTFANGGGWVRHSAAGHRVYDMSWNLMPASEIARLRAFFDGVYGHGPYYFVDPSAERTNVFPAAWAAPRLGLDGGPTLVYDQIPSREQHPGPNKTYPEIGARYVLDSESIPNTLKIPVPDGHRFHFRAGYQNPSSNQVEQARAVLLSAIASYTDAPVVWSEAEPADESAIWLHPVTGVARRWSGGGESDVVTRRNLVTNPRGRDALSGWSTDSADAHYDADRDAIAVSATASQARPFLTLSDPGVPEHCTVLTYLIDTSDGQPVSFAQYRNSGTPIGLAGQSVAPGDIVRHIHTGNGSSSTFVWRAQEDIGDRTAFFRALITEGDYTGPYFDGDTPDRIIDGVLHRYAWEDEPHASPSTETALAQGWYEITDEAVVAAAQPYAAAVAAAEGSAELTYRIDAGVWTPLHNTLHSIQGPGMAQFTIHGEGAVNVFWAQGVILPAHEPAPAFRDFYPGQGNSGVDFEDFQEHTHSVGNDLYGASVRLREVVSWT